jgi:hypothetical protein
MTNVPKELERFKSTRLTQFFPNDVEDLLRGGGFRLNHDWMYLGPGSKALLLHRCDPISVVSLSGIVYIALVENLGIVFLYEPIM